VLKRKRANVDEVTTAVVGTTKDNGFEPATNGTATAKCSPESSQSPSAFKSSQAFKNPAAEAMTSN